MLGDGVSVGSANGAWQLVKKVLHEVAGYVLSHQPMKNSLRVLLIVDGCVACAKI